MHLVDSTPIECARSRPTVRRSDLAGWAGYGYCASHSRFFRDLRLHLIAAPADLPPTGSHTIVADKGCRSPPPTTTNNTPLESVIQPPEPSSWSLSTQAISLRRLLAPDGPHAGSSARRASSAVAPDRTPRLGPGPASPRCAQPRDGPRLPGGPTGRAPGPHQVGQSLRHPSSRPARTAPASTSLGPTTAILTSHHHLHHTRNDSGLLLRAGAVCAAG